MSFRVVADVLDYSRADLGARLTLIVIAENAHDDGVAWPGEETIAAKANLSIETVRRSLRKLEDLGELEVRKAQWGRRRSNVYRVTVGAAGERAILTSHPEEVQAAFTTGQYARSSESATTGHPEPDDRASTPDLSEPLPYRVEPLLEPPSGGAELALVPGVRVPDSQKLVAFYVDSARELGAEPPRQTVGMVARQVKTLIEEGIDAEAVAGAIGLMLERRLHPATLPTLIVEAQAGPRRRTETKRYGRGMTTQQILDATKEG